jgi:probable addiction module antidote protein
MTKEKFTFTKEELKITRFSIFDYLETEEDMAGYLEACLEEGGMEQFFVGLGDVIKAKGIAQITKETGLSRESLYEVCEPEPDAQPRWSEIRKIIKALGLSLPASSKSRPSPKKTAQPKRRRKRDAVLA